MARRPAFPAKTAAVTGNGDKTVSGVAQKFDLRAQQYRHGKTRVREGSTGLLDGNREAAFVAAVKLKPAAKIAQPELENVLCPPQSPTDTAPA